MWPNPQFPEEIVNGKFHFLCNDYRSSLFFNSELREKSECRKMRTRKSPNTGTFHVVQASKSFRRVCKITCNSKIPQSRISHLKVFLEIWQKFTGKYLCQRLFFFIKLRLNTSGPLPPTILDKIFLKK